MPAHAIADLGAILVTRVRGKQGGHIERSPLLFLSGMKDCGSLACLLAALVRLHSEGGDAWRRHRCRGADRGLLVEQQRLLEADVPDLRSVTQHGARGRQRHLAVSGPRKYGDTA